MRELLECVFFSVREPSKLFRCIEFHGKYIKSEHVWRERGVARYVHDDLTK